LQARNYFSPFPWQASQPEICSRCGAPKSKIYQLLTRCNPSSKMSCESHHQCHLISGSSSAPSSLFGRWSAVLGHVERVSCRWRRSLCTQVTIKLGTYADHERRFASKRGVFQIETSVVQKGRPFLARCFERKCAYLCIDDLSPTGKASRARTQEICLPRLLLLSRCTSKDLLPSSPGSSHSQRVPAAIGHAPLTRKKDPPTPDHDRRDRF
jgi:hypothetical protein